MLTGIHFILTYTCNFECDHCFLYCGPRARGTFTIDQVTRVLEEAKKIGTVEEIFFEGGEPFLFFPLLAESIRRARAMGFQVGVVTNAYGALSEKDAELWLEPLARAGLGYLSISNDSFHYGQEKNNPAATALAAAGRLGLPASPIRIDPPELVLPSPDEKGKGQAIIGGGARFRGRAADKLTKGLPVRPWEELVECPYEALESPSRVHVDAFGNVHICQGISMGNMWDMPLSRLVAGYDPDSHPICGPLSRGGPAELVRASGLKPEARYVDECHLCYSARKAVIDKFPDLLGPRQVYGMV
jgi:hypothetical protein